MQAKSKLRKATTLQSSCTTICFTGSSRPKSASLGLRRQTFGLLQSTNPIKTTCNSALLTYEASGRTSTKRLAKALAWTCASAKASRLGWTMWGTTWSAQVRRGALNSWRTDTSCWSIYSTHKTLLRKQRATITKSGSTPATSSKCATKCTPFKFWTTSCAASRAPSCREAS